jgi:hypothetical protein
MSVALLLAALLVGISVPAIRSVTATQLKRSAGQIAGMAREGYARSAVSGKPHRLVMDLDEGTFWLEIGSGAFGLQLEKSKQLTESELAQRKLAKDPAQGSAYKFPVRDADLSEQDRLKKQLNAAPTWAPADDELGKPQKLPSDCAFEKVWVAHQAEAFVRGQTQLYFWPTGRTEGAVIRLTDDPEGRTRIISVKINGLTGRSQIADKALEIPSS